MDPLLFLLLFIVSLPGSASVWTQGRVSAQKGGSVSIPCRYAQQYKDSVKYWCRGVLWPTCIVLQRTDSPQGRAGLSITDDPAQQVFTVTMTNLQLWDTNKYWCAVKIKGIDTPDARAGVFLSVTRGTPPPGTPPSALPTGTPPPGTPPSALPTGKTLSASVSSPKGSASVWTQGRVSAQKGGSVSIPCRYAQQYKDSVKYWCRGVLWPTCIVLQRTDSPQGRAGLSITDDPAQQVFTVTMTNLQLWDTNKYWCAVKIKGIDTPDARAGVFLSVTRGTPTPRTPPPVLSTGTLPPGTPPSALSTGTPPPGTPPSALPTGTPPPGTPPSALPTGKTLSASVSSPKGSASMWTQGRVSAQKGGSVSIPCRYAQQYKDSVKYWCRGVLWPTCIVLQRTDSPQGRAGLSITDDPAQQVFTVTMTNLQLWDTNKYWCGVKIKGIDTPDARAGVFLSVTRALPPMTPRAAVSIATPPSAGRCVDCTSPPPSARSAWSPALSPSAPSSTTPPVSLSAPSSPPTAMPPNLKTTPPPTAMPPTLKTTPPPTATPLTLKTTSPPTAMSPSLKTTFPATATPPTLKTTSPPTATPPTLKTTSPPTATSPTLKTTSPPTATSPTLKTTSPPTATPPTLKTTSPPTATPPTLKTTSPPTATSPTLKTTSELGTLFAVTSMAPPSAWPKRARSPARPGPPATPSAPASRAVLNRANPQSLGQHSLRWWQSLLVACGVLLLVATVAMVTWKTWRRRESSYSRWEMDELESNLVLHTESKNDLTGPVPLFLGREPQGEHLL
ncbi:mucin-2-like isoform X4 [Anguilla anguilla]|uniref:mucin-2-like isoform X4 n=1 Tax=Anguilla anguilla TaxID=7936 RepID=UPI0015B2350E|nr:mucin-2-like isoform X4 [Anguilla anguilla]